MINHLLLHVALGGVTETTIAIANRMCLGVVDSLLAMANATLLDRNRNGHSGVRGFGDLFQLALKR
jgi:hypothetical protein